jgi:hypothetical protein
MGVTHRLAGMFRGFPIIDVTRARDGDKQIKGDNPCKAQDFVGFSLNFAARRRFHARDDEQNLSPVDAVNT